MIFNLNNRTRGEETLVLGGQAPPAEHQNPLESEAPILWGVALPSHFHAPRPNHRLTITPSFGGLEVKSIPSICAN
jgi:hypothetical protein